MALFLDEESDGGLFWHFDLGYRRDMMINDEYLRETSAISYPHCILIVVVPFWGAYLWNDDFPNWCWCCCLWCGPQVLLVIESLVRFPAHDGIIIFVYLAENPTWSEDKRASNL